MDGRSVFFEEWLNSLREQYKQAARADDQVSLPTLTAVMQNVGFDEAELAQLRLEATLRQEDVAGDFAPDMNILSVASAHPAECLCPQCAPPIDESAFDADGQPIARDPEEAAHEAGAVFPAADFAARPAEEDIAEEDPLTFEDSLKAEDQETAAADSGAELPETAEAEDGENEDSGEDSDSPQQISLF